MSKYEVEVKLISYITVEAEDKKQAYKMTEKLVTEKIESINGEALAEDLDITIVEDEMITRLYDLEKHEIVWEIKSGEKID
jgi:hypothetical protein